jgi:hypothetical protein
MRYQSNTSSAHGSGNICVTFLSGIGGVMGCVFRLCRRMTGATLLCLCGSGTRRTTLPGMGSNGSHLLPSSMNTPLTPTGSGHGSSTMTFGRGRWSCMQLFRLIVLLCMIAGCCLYAYNFFVLVCLLSTDISPRNPD